MVPLIAPPRTVNAPIKRSETILKVGVAGTEIIEVIVSSHNVGHSLFILPLYTSLQLEGDGSKGYSDWTESDFLPM